MGALEKSGVLSEMECGNNFAYVLNDSSLFLSTEYKVLQNQEEGSFIRCMKLLYNGKIQFYYLTNGYISLEKMLPALDADSFMTILSDVFLNVLSVKHNGFLSCQSISISFDKIFVDSNTYKVALVYLPISRRFYADEPAFENELRTGLVKILSETANLSSAKLYQFMSDLSDGTLSLKDLYERMKGGKTPFSSEHAESGKRGASKGTRTLRIIAVDASEPIEIEVTKDNFIIGKNAAMADGVIPHNKLVSRKHCRITRGNGQFMITDLDSVNGTYVNRIRLVPNRAYPLKEGDDLRLANSNFRVVIA